MNDIVVEQEIVGAETDNVNDTADIEHVDDIVSDSIDDVNASVDDVLHETPDNSVSDDALIDSTGTIFDENIHAVNRNGEPSYTKSGRFRKKARKVVDRESVGQEERAEIEQYERAAAGTVATIEMIGVMLGGDSFRYIKDKKMRIDERAAGVDAFTNYYREYGITDFPPGIALTLWGLTYALPRFAQPEVRQRFGWVKKGIRKIKQMFVK